MHNFFFLDIEASSLLSGFPVEVGWAKQSGTIIKADSIAIAPLDVWLDKYNWSTEAETVHGLSLNDLREIGYLPQDACRYINDQLSDSYVVFDTGLSGTDIAWLKLLYAGTQVTPSFSFLSVNSEELVQNRLGLSGFPQEVVELLHRAAPAFTHRAAEDASHWAWWLVAIDAIENLMPHWSEKEILLHLRAIQIPRCRISV